MPLFEVRYREGALVLAPRQALNGPDELKITLPGGLFAAPRCEECHDARWGSGHCFVMESQERTVELTLIETRPFLLLETRIKNPSSAAVTHDVLTMASFDISSHTAGASVTWKTLGSGGMAPVGEVSNSFAYLAVADPLTRNGVVCAWLTQHRGLGTFLPTYENGMLRVAAELEFGNLRIAPHGTRDTDRLILGFFSDVRIGLECYADEIAASEGIHLKPKTGVYCSWYHRRNPLDGASDHELVSRNAAFASEHLRPFGLGVYQIDDHWQRASDGRPFTPGELAEGPIKTFTDSNAHFPHGMKAVASVLKERGLVPGLWFMPFSADSNSMGTTFPSQIFALDPDTGMPLRNTRWSGTTIDSTSPSGEAFLRNRFRRIRDWGFGYVKVDGIHIGAPSDNFYIQRIPSGKSLRPAVLNDPDKTFLEAFRDGLALLREEMRDVFILGCTPTQNMVALAPAFGLLDACRIGPDNDRAAEGDWEHVLRGAEFAGTFWFLNNRVWHNDPDPIYVRASNPLKTARWMASWIAVSGVMNTTSEIFEDLPPERLDLLKRTLPAHDFMARPVDILDRRIPAVWVVGNGRQWIIGLFNPSEHETLCLRESFERLGLDPSETYEVFDYWNNDLLAPIRGSLEVELEGGGCRVLALRDCCDHPQVLSTSRHITQGLVDLVSESWCPDKLTLRGTSRLVAGDACELRIVCPDGLVPLDSPRMILRQEKRILRATINPDCSGETDWSVTFRRGENMAPSPRFAQVA
jgi:hypothetical protein